MSKFEEWCNKRFGCGSAKLRLVTSSVLKEAFEAGATITKTFTYSDNLVDAEQEFFDEYPDDCFVARECFRGGFSAAEQEKANLVDDYQKLGVDCARLEDDNTKLRTEIKDLYSVLKEWMRKIESYEYPLSSFQEEREKETCR